MLSVLVVNKRGDENMQKKEQKKEPKNELNIELFASHLAKTLEMQYPEYTFEVEAERRKKKKKLCRRLKNVSS